MAQHNLQMYVKGLAAMVGPNNLRSYDGFLEKVYFQYSFDLMGALLNITQLPVCPLRSNCAFKKIAFYDSGGYWDVTAEDMEIAFRIRKLGRMLFNRDLSIYAATRRIRKHGMLKTTGRNVLAYFRFFFKRPERGLNGAYFRDNVR